MYIFLSSHFQHAKHFVAVFRRTYSLVTAGSERVKIQLNNLEYINNLNSEYIHSDEGLGLKTSALKLSTVVNLHCQLGCNIKFRSNKIRAWRVHSRKVENQYTGTFYFIFMCSLIPFILESRILIKFNEAFFTCETKGLKCLIWDFVTDQSYPAIFCSCDQIKKKNPSHYWPKTYPNDPGKLSPQNEELCTLYHS